jgi:predicted nucleic acid-binding protein
MRDGSSLAAAPLLRGRWPDPGDDYLLALAAATQAALVSGDKHLLSLESALPIYRPTAFLDTLTEGR